ncbi:uncharacterized protein DUF4091 [Serratia fonticola]|uniref:Uncharacterized protein DUF4091 n=1 Tax=Serratia fonticola TaxID=47917 RepID=A0A559TB92_SERFO|nr:DUF4091 domain-containing protein [Serratia fonticola]TQI80594.1 uncharacterized protein DUF4091 [Serratia fonticola]TQI97381.1 uncharacterized protein DUF4091 [Serratia fonticola]TVZ71877.1 uncharacterized protein DUF4091 [Serratia fonticola]
MRLSLIFTHCLEKIFHQHHLPQIEQQRQFSCLDNESLSWQAVYCLYKEDNETRRELRYRLEGELAEYISVRQVQSVPSHFPCYAEVDENYLTTEPGLFPDLLMPIAEQRFFAACRYYGSLWFTFSPPPKGMSGGDYPLTLTLFDQETDEELAVATMTLHVVATALPRQTLLHTEWLHTDCLADYYQIAVFSTEYWQAVRNYVRNAVANGVNMLLTPIFTPPLDTAIGGERTTVQLIGVARTAAGFQFDFSRLAQWVDLAQEEGIEHFEISPLFTQWGAAHAPKIVVDVAGEMQKLFGWHTDAHGHEYQQFLQALLPELTGWFRKRNLQQNVWFHISDEPRLENITDYQRASDALRPLLDGFRTFDALSDFDFYQRGLVETPVVATDHLEPFLEHQVPHLWAYYCCLQKVEVSNRFFAQPSARNRILGVQLYLYHISGFLHWGYNFYNSSHSLEKLNPYAVTDSGNAFPSGDPFVVYPGPDLMPLESLRLRVFHQGLQDLRALQLLESLTDRSTVEQLIEQALGMRITFKRYPHQASALLRLREAVNARIEAEL